MKLLCKVLLTSVTLLTGVYLVYAQAPQKFNYQAVCRDNSGNIIANQSIVLRMTIHDSLPGGTILYQETHSLITNSFGLANIAVGGGTLVMGNFSTISWGIGDKYLQIELDAGTGFNAIGTTQLLSVPYALFAKMAENVNVGGHYVGELYGGGVVFWVDHTGQHGLIVSMVDISPYHTWSNITAAAIDSTNEWDGFGNTMDIIGQSGHTNSAAQLCVDYVNSDYGTGIYSDWYLPSITELNHIWNNFYEIQKVLTNDGNAATTPLSRVTYYWSSSEYNISLAWYFSFRSGMAENYYKSSSGSVCAVRAF